MENRLVTIATFSYAPEMGLVRSKLESEGIECFVKDELVSQTYIHNAVGGMKLQVKADDAEWAARIVEEMGIFEQDGGKGSKLGAFDRVTRRMPLLGGMSLVVRFFALLVLIAIILSLVYLMLVF
ncbi:putative signal transducing protein [Marinilabilia rubra]|uniref:DUF2007 domain-containing protein n=1 Tax=Marinilabilia rubra TaxID=2162893 RepID=A0A2U2BA46_9BACT|nr:DUF2007 domain-containing protein [Marinilabilia rubra]PWD99912.1 hypothetical protein DDZ16_08460 [Marinilabilia rubra]